MKWNPVIMYECPYCKEFSQIKSEYCGECTEQVEYNKSTNSDLKEELRKIIFSDEFGWVDNHEWMMDGDKSTELLFNWFVKNALTEVSQLEPLVNPATCDTKPTIELLMDSFNKAQEHLDGGTFDDLRMACAELVISNAEARQKLSKLSG